MVLLPQLFGPAGFFSNFFLNPSNVLLALALLIALILLYLIKPRPVNVSVPSLMFILSDLGKSNVRRFFRSIFRDVLFIIQALIVIMLGLALAKPFINVSQESQVQQSILVIDDSASTRAFGDDRFESIKSAAKDSLASQNIIILSQQNPRVIDDAGNVMLSAGDAKDMISDLAPTDMDGDLPGALDIAAQYAGPGSKVTILSDLVLSRLESPSLIDARIKLLKSKGALVEIKAFNSSASNIGIIGATLNSKNATIDVKIQNFNGKPEDIALEYNGNAISLDKKLLEAQGRPGSLLSVSVPLAHGVSELKLTNDDDFDTDNHYYISTPERDTINILVISNDPALQQSKLLPALHAAGDSITKVNLQYGVPPKIPDLNHQVYIIKDVTTGFVLPGVISDLEDRVKNGAVLVVYAQDNLFSLDLKDLLPVKNKEADKLTGRLEVIANSSTGLMRGLSDPGQVDGSQLLRVERTDDTTVHAYIMTNDGPEPVIAHKRIGKGVVIYYGIKDRKQADLDPQTYAVLWGRIVDYSIPDMKLLNVGTGVMISSSTSAIKTPFGSQRSPVLATLAGMYQAGQTSIAANLYPLQISQTVGTDTNTQYESFVGRGANIEEYNTEAAAQKEDVKMPEDLSNTVIIAAMAVMLFELVYIKFRGDL